MTLTGETNSRFQRTAQISSSMRTKNKLTVLIDYRTFSRFVKIFTYKKRYTFRRITSTFNGKKCATSRKRVDSSARFSSFTKHFQIGIKKRLIPNCRMRDELRNPKEKRTFFTLCDVINSYPVLRWTLISVSCKLLVNDLTTENRWAMTTEEVRFLNNHSEHALFGKQLITRWYWLMGRFCELFGCY